MITKEWKRAILLYKRYKVTTFEYRNLARKEGLDMCGLNGRIHQILRDRQRRQHDGSLSDARTFRAWTTHRRWDLGLSPVERSPKWQADVTNDFQGYN